MPVRTHALAFTVRDARHFSINRGTCAYYRAACTSKLSCCNGYRASWGSPPRNSTLPLLHRGQIVESACRTVEVFHLPRASFVRTGHGDRTARLNLLKRVCVVRV